MYCTPPCSLLISEKVNKYDRENFKDYVIFTDNYKNEYNKLIKLTQSEIQKKADEILSYIKQRREIKKNIKLVYN